MDFAWHESAEDATSAAIHKSGKPLKAVAAECFQDLKMDTAYARLRGCLNPERPEKLSADEHIRIANITGQFDFLYYCSQSCHHSRPELVAAEDESTELRRKMLTLGGELKGLFTRLEQLETNGNVTGMRQGRAA